MDVVPGILMEKEATLLTQQQLDLFAKCCSDLTVQAVYAYYIQTQDLKLKDMILHAFRDEFGMRALGKDEDLKDTIDFISSLQYWDIFAEQPIDYLQKIKNSISEILDMEDTSPYISPIDNNNYDSLMKSLKESGKTKILVKQLKTFKDSFRSKNGDRAKSTVFKRVFSNTGKLNLIYQGVNFLITARESNIPADRWRRL